TGSVLRWRWRRASPARRRASASCSFRPTSPSGSAEQPLALLGSAPGSSELSPKAEVPGTLGPKLTRLQAQPAFREGSEREPWSGAAAVWTLLKTRLG